ncbi:MAG: hypothetical protein ACYCZN_11375 [Candidatus Dormibacteria bacterium]
MVAKTRGTSHRWEFKPRFRRRSFGWRAQPAILRVRQAVAEIRKEARRDPAVGAEGAVTLLELLSPALEQVDSSSGAIGTAVNHAIAELVPIIGGAPATIAMREAWLERLWTAYEADRIPYIESLGDRWGELCSSREVAATWADRLIDITRMALGPDPSLRGYFPGSSACLSALYHAARYQEILDIVGPKGLWAYQRWAVRALAALGRAAEAIHHAEACRGPWTPDADVDRVCEEILLSSGLADEAYSLYGLRANRGATYLATFRQVARRYPERSPQEVLADLVRSTPGEEGKWFAAARQAATPEEALALAMRSPCDPRTLTRAARDWADEHPVAAMEAGLLALSLLVGGYGRDVTGADVWAAYSNAMTAARRTGGAEKVRERVRQLLAEEGSGGWLEAVLGRELEP